MLKKSMTNRERLEYERIALKSQMDRIYTLFEDGGSFGVVAGFVEGYLYENIPYIVNLCTDIKKICDDGDSYIPIEGRWVDDNGEVVWDKCSIWVPNISREVIKAIAVRYNQNGYIWGSNSKWGLYEIQRDEPVKTGITFSVTREDGIFRIMLKNDITHCEYPPTGSAEDEHNRIVLLRKQRDEACKRIYEIAKLKVQSENK